MLGNCVTDVSASARVRSAEVPRFEASAVIGTLFIVWLCVVPAIWLAWAVSHVPAFFISLTARVRKAVPYS
jgi:hypothetical protein